MAKCIWHVRNCSLFEKLSNEQLASLEGGARTKSFAKGTTIYFPQDEADAVFLLVSGRVRLGSATPDGKLAILGFIEAGELFGELSLVDVSQREERSEAVRNSVVVVLPTKILCEIMDESPSLAIGVTKLIGFRRKRVERRLKSLLFRSNRERLIALLLDLSEQYGKTIPGPVTKGAVHLDIKLSHQDLANIIGATREAVTITLGEMQQQGLLTIQRQSIILKDITLLAAEANAIAHSALRSPSNKSKRETSTGLLFVNGGS